MNEDSDNDDGEVATMGTDVETSHPFWVVLSENSDTESDDASSFRNKRIKPGDFVVVQLNG